MGMSGRYGGANGTEPDDEYRYGFQGQEKDDEWTGQTGSHLNYKYRMYDSRIGRFFAIDPLAAKYPYNSTYAFSVNRVIDMVELEGLEASPMYTKDPITGVTTRRINVKIKITSSTTVSESILKERTQSGARAAEEIYKGYDPVENVNNEMKITIDYAFDENLGEGDYYVEYTPKIEGGKREHVGKVDEIGNSDENRIQVKLAVCPNCEDNVNRTKEKTNKTFAHEIFHTLGLRHSISSESDIYSIFDFGIENIMHNSTSEGGTGLTNEQRKKIWNNVLIRQKPLPKDVKNQY